MAPLPEPLQESLEILGRWTLELHIFSAFGMHESQSPRVEGLSVHLLSPSLRGRVVSISPQGHAMVGKLCPDLILQAGYELSLKEGRALEPLQDLEPSYGQGTPLPFTHNQLSESPLHQLEPVSELPLVMHRAASHYCQVNSPGAVGAKLPSEMGHGMPCPSKDHEARGVAIYPVDWEKVGATLGKLLEKELLRARSPRAPNGDREEPSRFVYDEYLRVLVDYLGLEGSSSPRDRRCPLPFQRISFSTKLESCLRFLHSSTRVQKAAYSSMALSPVPHMVLGSGFNHMSFRHLSRSSSNTKDRVGR